MEPNPETAEAILQQLVFIKWALVAIAAGLGLLLFALVVLVVGMKDIGKETGKRYEAQIRQAGLEDLLANGQSTAAKETALAWVAAEPRRAEAHWALARAHFQLGELVEAKQVLEGLRRIAPDEQYRVDAWLDLLDKEFSSRRPRPVN